MYLSLRAEGSYEDVVKSIEIVIEGIELVGPLGKTVGELWQRTLWSLRTPFPFRPWWGGWRALQEHAG